MAEMAPGTDRAYAESKVKGPAIALIVVASLHLVLATIGLILNLIGAGFVATEGDANMMAQAGGNVAGAIVGICIQGLILFGAVKMMRLESFGLAMTAAILSVIPCLSSCVVLGIPFGIWALVAINDANVKASFR